MALDDDDDDDDDVSPSSASVDGGVAKLIMTLARLTKVDMINSILVTTSA